MTCQNIIKATLLLLALAACAGCETVSVFDQRLLAKPNMVFAQNAVFNYESKLVPQIETGASTSGGAQAAGCTSCR